jgi:hypothetical protein
MRYRCTSRRLPDGRWSLEYAGRDAGAVRVTAATRHEAIDKMRGELRYRLELCPCTGESYQHLEVEVAED